MCNKDGCGCSPDSSHLSVIEGGKAKGHCQHKKIELNSHSYLVEKSISVFQQFEDGELSKDMTLGYLKAMEDFVKIIWGEDNSLFSIQKLISEVKEY